MLVPVVYPPPLAAAEALVFPWPGLTTKWLRDLLGQSGGNTKAPRVLSTSWLDTRSLSGEIRVPPVGAWCFRGHEDRNILALGTGCRDLDQHTFPAVGHINGLFSWWST